MKSYQDYYYGKESNKKMSEQIIDESKVTIVVVGFKHDQENSIHYEKLHNPKPTDVGMSLWKAFIKGADFASIRFIKGRAKK